MWFQHVKKFLSFQKPFFPSKKYSTIVSDEMQQGDIYENVWGTPTAFNPDLSHTHRKRFTFGNCFCYISVFLFFSLSHSLFTSTAGIFSQTQKRAQKHRNKSNKIIYVDLGLREGWDGEGSCIIDSLHGAVYVLAPVLPY